MREIGAESQLVAVSIACGSAAEADGIATAMVEARLAACAQVWPIRSTYRWRGAVATDAEHLLSVKTVAALLPELEALVLARHSYEVPEIVAQPIEWTTAAYGRWIRDSVQSG